MVSDASKSAVLLYQLVRGQAPQKHARLDIQGDGLPRQRLDL